MNRQVGKEREGRRSIRVMERVGSLAEGQAAEPAALRVGEEREASPEARSKGGLHLGLIDADHDQARVADLELVLEPAELSHVALLLRTPPSARCEKNGRITPGDLG